MVFPTQSAVADDYAAMAQRHAGRLLRRTPQTAAQRSRVCSESFSELGFLMLIAYQLQDAVGYYSMSALETEATAGLLAEDASFDFVAEPLATAAVAETAMLNDDVVAADFFSFSDDVADDLADNDLDAEYLDFETADLDVSATRDADWLI